MRVNTKFHCVVVALIGGAIAAPQQAEAITVEVAKKCRALTSKEYPPREIGNPAAGSAKGSGLAQQAYFKRCTENNGNMDSKAAPK
jgi:hypothetical protein